MSFNLSGNSIRYLKFLILLCKRNNEFECYSDKDMKILNAFIKNGLVDIVHDTFPRRRYKLTPLAYSYDALQQDLSLD